MEARQFIVLWEMKNILLKDGAPAQSNTPKKGSVICSNRVQPLAMCETITKLVK